MLILSATPLDARTERGDRAKASRCFPKGCTRHLARSKSSEERLRRLQHPWRSSVGALRIPRNDRRMYYQIDTERGHLIGDGASKADQSVPWPTSLPGLACLRGASCGHMPVRRNGPQCSDPPRTPPRSPLPPHRSPWPPQRRRGFTVGHEEPSPSRVPPLQRTGSFDLVELFGTVQVFS